MPKRIEGDTSSGRPSGPKSTQAKAGGLGATTDSLAGQETRSRVDQFVEIIDHCAAAKAGADALGEKFLSYLLAMAIQESRAAVRRNSLRDKSPN